MLTYQTQSASDGLSWTCRPETSTQYDRILTRPTLHSGSAAKISPEPEPSPSRSFRRGLLRSKISLVQCQPSPSSPKLPPPFSVASVVALATPKTSASPSEMPVPKRRRGLPNEPNSPLGSPSARRRPRRHPRKCPRSQLLSL